MDKYSSFTASMKTAVDEFNKLDGRKTVRIIAHMDADGICAASILIRAFLYENRRYSITLTDKLDSVFLKGLSNERYDIFLFLDIGSTQISQIKKLFAHKTVFILDHHIPGIVTGSSIIHVNPYLNDIDGSKEISGAGIAYLFAKTIKLSNMDMAHMAIVGAIGDNQDENDLGGLNAQILEDAIVQKKVKYHTGLKLCGVNYRPLYKMLESTIDPFIPGVSGTERGAMKFLQKININPKFGTSWKKFMHMSDGEIKKLISALNQETSIPIAKLTLKQYYLPKEQKDTPTADAKEYSQLLDACSLLGKGSYGIATCLGDKKIKKKAIGCFQDYKKYLLNAIKWYEQEKDGDTVQNTSGYILIDSENRISHHILDRFTCILSNHYKIAKGTLIAAITCKDENLYLSIRMAYPHDKNTDLYSMVAPILKNLKLSIEGNKEYAFVVGQSAKKEKILSCIKTVLEKTSLEEKI